MGQFGDSIAGKTPRVSPCQDLGSGKGALRVRVSVRQSHGRRSGRDGQAASRVLAAEGSAGPGQGRGSRSPRRPPYPAGAAQGHMPSHGHPGWEQLGTVGGCSQAWWVEELGAQEGGTQLDRARVLASRQACCPLGLPCHPHLPGGPGAGRPGEGGSAQLLRGLFVPCPAEGVCPELGCQCVQPEFHCGDPQCKSCKYYSCPPGQWARPVGKWQVGVAQAGRSSQQQVCKEARKWGVRTRPPGRWAPALGVSQRPGGAGGTLSGFSISAHIGVTVPPVGVALGALPSLSWPELLHPETIRLSAGCEEQWGYPEAVWPLGPGSDYAQVLHPP